MVGLRNARATAVMTPVFVAIIAGTEKSNESLTAFSESRLPSHVNLLAPSGAIKPSKFPRHISQLPLSLPPSHPPAIFAPASKQGHASPIHAAVGRCCGPPPALDPPTYLHGNAVHNTGPQEPKHAGSQPSVDLFCGPVCTQEQPFSQMRLLASRVTLGGVDGGSCSCFQRKATPEPGWGAGMRLRKNALLPHTTTPSIRTRVCSVGSPSCLAAIRLGAGRANFQPSRQSCTPSELSGPYCASSTPQPSLSTAQCGSPASKLQSLLSNAVLRASASATKSQPSRCLAWLGAEQPPTCTAATGERAAACCLLGCVAQVPSPQGGLGSVPGAPKE
jgi:hypothetical protein